MTRHQGEPRWRHRSIHVFYGGALSKIEHLFVLKKEVIDNNLLLMVETLNNTIDTRKITVRLWTKNKQHGGLWQMDECQYEWCYVELCGIYSTIVTVKIKKKKICIECYIHWIYIIVNQYTYLYNIYTIMHYIYYNIHT